MNSEIRVHGPRIRVYVTLGTSLTVAMVVSMFIFPDVWRIAVYGVLGVAGLVAAVSIARMGYLTVHEVKMLEIERNNARVLQVPATHYVYHTGINTVKAHAVGMLPKTVDAPEWTIKAEVTDPETHHIQLLNLSMPPEPLRRFAGAVRRGDSFSERTATGAGLSQLQFYDLRDELIDRRMAFWKNPHQHKAGVELAISGKALLRGIADSPLPHRGN